MYAAVAIIDAESAPSLLALEDGLSAGKQAPSFLIRILNERLNAVKSKWTSSWCLEAEDELLTAKLYLYGACLAKSEDAGFRTRSDPFQAEVLQASHSASVQLATILTRLHEEFLAHLQGSGAGPGWWPLPGEPRRLAQSDFFAASVPLRYLNDPHRTPEDEREAARNAFGEIYQMFASIPTATQMDHDDTTKILQASCWESHQQKSQRPPFLTCYQQNGIFDSIQRRVPRERNQRAPVKQTRTFVSRAQTSYPRRP